MEMRENKNKLKLKNNLVTVSEDQEMTPQKLTP